MSKFINSKKDGFTFVELLFAIVVMGTMFGLALTVFVGMLRFYVFANSVRQNQENSRNVLDTISRDIKFGKLLLPNNRNLSNRICVYSSESNRATLYSLESGKIFRYVSNSTFPTFNEAKSQISSSCSTTNTLSTSEITLPNTKVVTFEAYLVDGASTTAYTDVASVTIKFENITGNTSGNSCITSDIYCNKLTLNTAINIRGGD